MKGSDFTDLISGILLIGLATTLVAHKETGNIVKSVTAGTAENLKVAEGYGLGGTA